MGQIQSALIATLFCLYLCSSTHAQVIAPSAIEVNAEFSVSFLASADETHLDLPRLANEHAAHLFGVFHSPELTETLGLDSEIQTNGFAAAKQPIEILQTDLGHIQGRWKISYRAKAIFLMHRKAAEKILNLDSWQLPMPYDLDAIYKEECTDDYYNGIEDYWYFWNPYREGCEDLLREPATRKISFKLSPQNKKVTETHARFDLLRGDNQNGKLFQIGVIQGYDLGPKDPKDLGRKNFRALNTALRKMGFEEEVAENYQDRPLHIFRMVTDDDVEVEIHHRLVRTEIDSKTVTFAKDFKRMVEDFDVIIYGGHSGLGGNLDIPSLELKAKDRKGANQTFNFRQDKRQVFFFDSCASYSYYFDMFRDQKEKKSKIDILTNGLSSYFEGATPLLLAFLEHLLYGEKDLTWHDVLSDMEKTLEGDSFLLNVGGV